MSHINIFMSHINVGITSMNKENLIKKILVYFNGNKFIRIIVQEVR